MDVTGNNFATEETWRRELAEAKEAHRFARENWQIMEKAYQDKLKECDQLKDKIRILQDTVSQLQATHMENL